MSNLPGTTPDAPQDAGFDRAALSSLRERHLDVLDRSVPVDSPTDLAELLRQERQVPAGGFLGPVASLDLTSLEHNIAAMAAWCEGVGVSIAPHAKSTMAPDILAAQIAAGAWAMTVATVGQARICRSFGVRRILIANEVVDPIGLRWIAAEQDRDPLVDIMFWVDSMSGVRAAEDAAVVSGSARPLSLLVEWGVPQGRAGCRSTAEAVEFATAVHRSESLRLRGIAGYEGVLADPTTTAATVEAVERYLTQICELAAECERLDLFDPGEEIILTAGGSAFFDRVAAVLTRYSSERSVRTVIRSGCYVIHDDGLYRSLTPSTRDTTAPTFRPALRVLSQLTSRPEPELCLLAAGRRDLSYDNGLPEVTAIRRRSASIVWGPDEAAGGFGLEIEGLTITSLNDQHAFLQCPADSTLAVGDWVELGISHPCTTMEKWPEIPVVRDGVLVDLYRTHF